MDVQTRSDKMNGNYMFCTEHSQSICYGWVCIGHRHVGFSSSSWLAGQTRRCLTRLALPLQLLLQFAD